MKIKICLIISNVDFSRQFLDIDKEIDSGRYELSYLFLSPQIPTLQKSLEENGRTVKFINYTGRKDLPKVIVQIFTYLGQIKPDIVHTHLVDASIAGLTAAKFRRIKNRIHTRHHSIENYIYYPHGVYYDKFINYLSKKIIAISNVTAKVLTERERVSEQKITLIEHGFNFEDYTFSPAKVDELKHKYNLSGAYPVIGVISRFVEGKGVEFIIPAFRQLKQIYPQSKLVLANARGSYADEIKQLLNQNLDKSDYVLIEFEKNFVELYKMFDVFVHVPINSEFEAFGQTYIESLALEIPSVFTLSGIAADFIEDKKNALVVPFKDSDAIFKAIKLILEDDKLRTDLIKNGKTGVSERFALKRMVKQLEETYESL